MKIRKFVMWINFLSGLFNVYLFLEGYHVLSLTLFGLNLTVVYVVSKSPAQLFISAVSYPLGLLHFHWKPSWRGIEHVGVDIKASESEPEENMLTMKDYIFIGTPGEKKSAILELVEKVLSGSLRAGEVVNVLKHFLSDEHPDVALYASEGIEKVEIYLIEKMNKFKGDPLEFVKVILDYIDSGFAYGNLKSHYRSMALESLKSVEKGKEFYLLSYRLTGDKGFLEKGLKETHSKEIARELALAEIASGNVKRASKIWKEFVQEDERSS